MVVGPLVREQALGGVAVHHNLVPRRMRKRDGVLCVTSPNHIRADVSKTRNRRGTQEKHRKLGQRRDHRIESFHTLGQEKSNHAHAEDQATVLMPGKRMLQGQQHPH